MRTTPAPATVVLLLLSNPAFAHRLDEYLQATTISIEKDRVAGQLRLTPGVAVFPIVIAAIDTDHDEVISNAEQKAYAGRVLADLSLFMDGESVKLQLVSTAFPTRCRESRHRSICLIHHKIIVPARPLDVRQRTLLKYYFVQRSRRAKAEMRTGLALPA